MLSTTLEVSTAISHILRGYSWLEMFSRILKFCPPVHINTISWRSGFEE